MNLERKFIDLAEFKQFEDGNGGLTGYASKFNEIDSVDDIVLPGAYGETLEEFIKSGWLAPDHTWGVASDLGIISSAFEDEVGLMFSAEFHPTADAQQVRQKILNRLAKGKSVKLSIGYVPTEVEQVSGKEAAKILRNASPATLKAVEAKQQIRLLKKIKLFEVSLVSVPALASASVTGAKALDSEADDADQPHAGLKFGQHSEAVLAAVEEFQQRAKALSDLRVKEGRTLSSVNRDRLKTLHQRMSQLMSELDELITQTEPKPKEAEKASEADLAALLAQIELTKLNLQSRK